MRLPCPRFCDGLRQLLSHGLVVATSQVSASTHTLSQGIGWQPFRGSGKDKKYLRGSTANRNPAGAKTWHHRDPHSPSMGNQWEQWDMGCLSGPWLVLPVHIPLPAGGQKLHPLWQAALPIYSFPKEVGWWLFISPQGKNPADGIADEY